MTNRFRFLSRSVLAAATLVPAFAAANNVQAADYDYGYNYGYNYNYNRYQPGYNYWNTGYNNRYNSYSNYYNGYNRLNYGYNNWYGYDNYYNNNWGYGYNGYNNWNYGYNNGWYGYNNGWNGYNNGWNNYDYSYDRYNNYNSLSNDPNYTYWNGNHYYRMNDGSYRIYRNGSWVALDNGSNSSSGYESLRNDANYTYWNGNHYYRMNDGSYRIYRNGSWEPVSNTGDSNSGYNNLRNDSHYRYENGYHYYVLEDGSYYYYANGEWVLVKAAETPADPATPAPTPEPTPTPTPEPAPNDKPDQPVNPGTDQPVTPGTDQPVNPGTDQPVTPGTDTPSDSDVPGIELPPTPPFVHEDKPFNPFAPETPSTPADPSDSGSADQPATPAIPGNSGLVTTDEPSENQIPPYVEKPAEGLEHLEWAPNGQTPKIIYPSGKPGDAALEADPNYYYDGSTHYYYVPSNSERTGYSPYWKWFGDVWKLQGMTDPNDPALDPKLHENTADDEYMYSDRDSSVKLYSTNLVATGQAGQPLPFQNVEEFKNYVIEKMNPKFVDNSGWDAKVEWEIENPELFEMSKQNPWAKDYVLIANLKSGVDDDKYKDVEFGHVKFVYRIEATDATNYVALDKAKEAFAKINEERAAQGLKELAWSDDIYLNQALPKVHAISRQFDSSGFVGRRDDDPAVVAKKWANSGLREWLLDPNSTEGAVAAVVDGNGDYYWAFNYK
ncbi:Choline binding protein A [Streptococcus sp. DD11]|uniref:CAP domain-containing protein n=1 Tax=Streptococcus sp. DD11 TaxID=1777879 RepID=UPI000798EB1A|nr:CAP domain-containing protein [Streptococcus sp. DD11]KXT78361.1 Choline binding protein A [Streptococcus sp. DD11]